MIADSWLLKSSLSKMIRPYVVKDIVVFLMANRSLSVEVRKVIMAKSTYRIRQINRTRLQNKKEKVQMHKKATRVNSLETI